MASAPENMPISVLLKYKNPEESLHLSVKPTDNVGNVMDKITEATQVPRAQHVLKDATGHQLQGKHKKSLAAVGIKAGAVLHFFLNGLANLPETIAITVTGHNGQTHELSMKPDENVRALKEKLRTATGFSCERQRLSLGGKLLQSGLLYKQKVVDGCSLTLKEASNEEIEVEKEAKDSKLMLDNASRNKNGTTKGDVTKEVAQARRKKAIWAVKEAQKKVLSKTGACYERMAATNSLADDEDKKSLAMAGELMKMMESAQQKRKLAAKDSAQLGEGLTYLAEESNRPDAASRSAGGKELAPEAATRDVEPADATGTSATPGAAVSKPHKADATDTPTAAASASEPFAGVGVNGSHLKRKRQAPASGDAEMSPADDPPFTEEPPAKARRTEDSLAASGSVSGSDSAGAASASASGNASEVAPSGPDSETLPVVPSQAEPSPRPAEAALQAEAPAASASADVEVPVWE